MNIAILSGLIILVLLVIMLIAGVSIAVALGVSSICAILHQCYSSCSRNVYGYDTSLPDFYTKKVGGVKIETVFRQLLVYFAAIFIVLLLVTYIPALSLTLPKLMGYI